MMERLLYFSLLLCLVFTVQCYADEETRLKEMQIAANLSDKVSSRFETHLLFAYSQLGYTVFFDKIITGRARKMVASGDLDALMIAEKEIEEVYKDILRVPVVLARGSLILYCNKEVECHASALNNQNNTIGVISGNSISANYMRHLKASTYTVKGSENLGLMLSKKRLDYILLINGDKIGNLGGVDESLFQQVVINRTEGYHYIHNKHQHLFPQLTEALQLAMEKLGPLVELEAQASH